MREELVKDILQNRMGFIISNIDISANQSVHEAAMFVRLPAVIEAYRIARESDNFFDIDNPDPYAPEYQKAREYLRTELEDLIGSYEQITGEKLELHFHLPNGLSLARMWREPADGSKGTGNDGLGNDISDDLRFMRFTVLHVIETGEMARGLEPGSGGFAIRGVIPVIDPGPDGKFGTSDDIMVGSAEVLQQVAPIIDAATEEGKVYIALFANKELTEISVELNNPEKYPPVGDDFIRVVEANDPYVESYITPGFLLNGKNSDSIYFEDHGIFSYGAMPVHDFKGEQVGVLVCIMNTTTATAFINTGGITLAIVLACMVIIPTIVIFMIMRRFVSRPLDKMKSIIQDIAEDRADLSEKVPSDQHDEIGELAVWFNTLTAKLDGILAEREEMLEKINDESEKNEAMAHWYSSILDSIPFLISIRDDEMKLSFVNAALEDMLEKKREEVIGMPCNCLDVSICGTDKCAVVCANNGQNQTYFSHHNASFQVDVRKLTDLHGKLTGFIEIIQDISEKETLLQQQAEAIAASNAKSSFLASMSHEIRTPLNAIIGMTSIGMDAPDSDRMKYCFTRIEDASKHLLGVINDILDISKIEAGKLELSPTEFSFERMMQRVVGVANFRVDEKNLKLKVHIDNDIPRVLIGDDQYIAQVITNLLSNAVKFTPENGAIELDTMFIGEKNGLCTIKVSVTDTGIGLSSEQQTRLFQSFQQADSSTTRKFGGTGLGLSISKSIVEMMGGTIWVESEPNKGSTFAFTMQLERGADGDLDPKATDPVLGKLRVLAVDEEPDVLLFFKENMQRFGIHCDLMDSCHDALNMINLSEPYNIIFVDWHMLGPECEKLLTEVKDRVAAPGKAIVLMVSATEWNHVEARIRNTGVNKFIPKPLFTSSLLDTVQECLSTDQKGSADGSHDIDGIFEDHCILLAEDVDINRDIVMALLEPTNIKIDCAKDGAEAVRMFTEAPHKYEMIFMDVQMPEMDGWDATRKIRALDIHEAKSIPIIAMTANVFREDIEKSLESGMNGHVGKPLNFDEVIQQLKAYLYPDGFKVPERRREDRRKSGEDGKKAEDRRKGDRRQSTDRRSIDRRNP